MNYNRKRTETFETDISSRSDSLNDDDDFMLHLTQDDNLKIDEDITRKIENFITVWNLVKAETFAFKFTEL